MPSEKDADTSLVLRRLEPGDSVSGLSLGDARFTPLKTFLKKDAKGFEANNLARTYAIFEEGKKKVLAFITVICGEIAVENENGFQHDGAVDYRYDHFPAVKIARLAVDKKIQGKQIGRQLVNFSLGIMKEYICPHVGCRFAVVDAKSESVKFYESCGFTLIDTDENRRLDAPIMFIDLHRIDASA